LNITRANTSGALTYGGQGYFQLVSVPHTYCLEGTPVLVGWRIFDSQINIWNKNISVVIFYQR
jgi:hypothetical protein